MIVVWYESQTLQKKSQRKKPRENYWKAKDIY